MNAEHLGLFVVDHAGIGASHAAHVLVGRAGDDLFARHRGLAIEKFQLEIAERFALLAVLADAL
jgi:hypothetical protein